jgi:hypothetical protein
VSGRRQRVGSAAPTVGSAVRRWARRQRVGSAAACRAGASGWARRPRWARRPDGGLGGRVSGRRQRVGSAATTAPTMAGTLADDRDPRRRSCHERYGPRTGPDHASCAARHADGRDPTLTTRADRRVTLAWWTSATSRSVDDVITARWRRRPAVAAAPGDDPGHEHPRERARRGSAQAPGPVRTGEVLPPGTAPVRFGSRVPPHGPCGRAAAMATMAPTRRRGRVC